jgi:hypothetical protein
MDLMDLLSDPAYRHMLLNHVPIIGLTVALLVLLMGLLLRQPLLLLAGLLLVAVTVGTSLPIAHYGDAAYPGIYDTLDGHGRAWLDYHAHVAETWLPALYANTVLAVLALAIGVLRRPLLWWAAALVSLTTIVSITGASLVASSGGRIKHAEFRIQDPPVVPSSNP